MGASSLYVPPDHPTFRQIATGCHSDFRLIERDHEEHLLIEQIKHSIKFLNLTSATGGWKVVVIDDADLFNEKLREWEDFYNYNRPHA